MGSKKLIALASCVLALALVGRASADLVGHWRLDDGSGTTAVDSSGNGHDGTLFGDPQWVEGVYGGALQFAGSPDKVDIPYSEQLNPEAFSMSLWANVDPSGANHRAPISSRNDPPQQGYIIYVEPDNTWHFWTGPGWDNLAGPAAALGEWTHVAATYANETKKLYINGELVGEGTASVDLNTTRVLRIGSGANEIDGNYYFVGMIDDVAVFDHALTEAEVQSAMAGVAPAELAANPSPGDASTDVPCDAVLTWEAGELAAAHDVYFGTSFADVNDASQANPMDVLLSQGQATASYARDGSLEFGQTYYWRVDEVNSAPDNTIFKGKVWSFTAEPLAYPIADVNATSNGIAEEGVAVANIVNGSGLNEDNQHSTESADMWLASAPDAESLQIQYAFDRVYKMHEMLVWNYNSQFELLLGFGVKNVTVEYSENGADWTVLGDVELAQATASADYAANTTIDMQGVAAQYIRLTVNAGFGMMDKYGLSEVRFLYIPAHAREPQPATGDTKVSVDATLAWRAGRDAASHEVYLDTDEQAVIDGTALADAIEAASFAPGNLQFGSTYYWKVNETQADASWEGDLWSFSTQEYTIVEDFESYDDEENRIYETWLDGWVNETGSTVGYFEAPFAEKTIVNSGSQSMPLVYDNSKSPFYSEAEYEFGSQNWSTNGADTLVLNVHGVPPTFVERTDGSILMGSTGGDIWDTADAFRMAYKRLSGNGSIIARVDSIVNTSLWAKGGVMIRQSLDAGSTHAMVAVTPGNGVALQHRPTMNQVSLSLNQIELTAPYWVKLTRTGDTLTAERSEDGTNWVSITDDAAASSVEIPMTGDVFIGLALVSNNSGASPTVAEFSNVSTTGNVSGDWQIEDIGGAQLPSNDPTSMYVVIEDSAGKTTTVTSTDADLAVTPAWQAWEIPFSALSGVNLSNVCRWDRPGLHRRRRLRSTGCGNR